MKKYINIGYPVHVLDSEEFPMALTSSDMTRNVPVSATSSPWGEVYVESKLCEWKFQHDSWSFMITEFPNDNIEGGILTPFYKEDRNIEWMGKLKGTVEVAQHRSEST